MIKTFNSIEEVLAFIHECSQKGDEEVEPWQATLKPGDHFIRIMSLGYEVLVTYGVVRDPVQAEIDLGADEEEVEFQRQLRDSPHMKNYRYTRSYSEACPEGELGDVHISTVSSIITQEMFEKAKEMGWPSDPHKVAEIVRVNAPGGVA